jgi:uncharacterized membrane protein
MNRDEYLSDLAKRLAVPDDQRSEILEELAAHLGDGVADLMAQGRAPEAAETEVVRRLGSPEELARGLLRARRTRRQLAAAAGAGVIAAVRSGVLGTLAGGLLCALAALCATIAVQALRPVLGLPHWSGWSPGWNSVITGVALAIGAALAGAAAVRVVAARSWRPVSEVRPAVVLVGATVIGYFGLVTAQQSLNWASVLAFLAMPAAFAAGARFERIGQPRWRKLFFATAALLLGGLVVATAGGIASGAASEYQWTDTTHGYAMIAPWWQEPGSPNDEVVSSEMDWGTGAIHSVSIEGSSAAAIAKFLDWRLEAWRAEPPQDGWALVPGQTEPFATSRATVDGATVSGTITVNREPGVEWAQVVATALGPDGHRYLLWASGPQQSEFFGSVWSWFATLAR